jgi:hypothetical protein
MLQGKRQVVKGIRSRLRSCLGIRSGLACVCMTLMAPVAGIAQSQSTNATKDTNKVTLPVTADNAQSVTAPAGNPAMKSALKNLSPAAAALQKQLADDSRELLALAVSLKTEVDKTNQNMLSVAVIRKAEEIEKLAHNVKDKMKHEDGGI